MIYKKSIIPENLSFSKTDIVILILITIINFCNIIIYILYDETIGFLENLFITYNGEMIFLMILSIYIFKYKYYAHHLVGIIIFIISMAIIDYYKIKFNHEEIIFEWKHISLSVLHIIIESVLITYKKYLVDTKYFSFFTVAFLFGSISIISIIILLIFKSFSAYALCFHEHCISILDFIDEYFIWQDMGQACGPADRGRSHTVIYRQALLPRGHFTTGLWRYEGKRIEVFPAWADFLYARP